MKWIILAIAVVMYLLVILFQEKKVIMTTVAAAITVILGFMFGGKVFLQTQSAGNLFYHIFFELINWNILMIYVGSMIIAALFIYSKVPARIADFLVQHSPNTGIAVILILAMTGIISIFVENVATVLVMAPIALALSKKLKLNPVPFMIGLAVMSNLEGTATLVGDPPSMIFASYSGYNFNDFFFHKGKMSIFFIIQAGLLVGCVYFYFLFAKNGKAKVEVDKTDVISWFPFVLLLVMVFGLAGISFIPSDFPYMSGLFVITLGIIGLLWYRFIQKKEVSEIVSEENTEQEQTELQQLLEKWLNGEIELDDISLQKIYDKLGAVSQEDIDIMLEKYIEDAEEREKVSTVIYAVLTAVLTALVVAIFLQKKQGMTATINNETFSKSSVVMKETVAKLKEDFDKLYNIVKDNSEKTDKFVEAVKEASKLTEDQLKGIIGVLKIHYQEVDENEQAKDSQTK